MVLDLFSGARGATGGRRRSSQGGRHAAAAANESVGRAGRADSSRGGAAAGGRRRGRVDESVSASTEEDRQLFMECVAQVQKNLKGCINSPSALYTLGSYYTKEEPYVEGRPFCVSLSYATFLFHMQMARISVADVELYVQLIANVLSQLSEDEQLRHPFVQHVLHDCVFGLPSPTCRGAAHCVVLIPPQQYRAYATLATALISLDIVPLNMLYQFLDRLEDYCNATSPIVANRALGLFVQSVSQVRVDEQITALQHVLRMKPVKINVDFLLACFERLKRAVVDPANGPTHGRALSIHCSELFLRFRSPARREYVEQFLYPSLCHPDMADFLEIPSTREHLLKELLGLCVPGLSTTNPFYMCICAVLQGSFDDEIDGALEVVALINCQMPHAAYFMSALAIDTRMSVSMFAKATIALLRGAGLAMTGRDVSDEVATSINRSRTSVYSVLFLLREVVRSCSVTASRRASDMLKALRVAVPPKTVEALGKLSETAFDGRCDITVDPQLLCAELAMVLHHEHIEAAVESSVEYFKDATMQCSHCGLPRSAALLCPVNGTVHVTGQTSVSRVLSTLAECAGEKVLEECMIRYLRDPSTQMSSAAHFLLYHILANAGQHRNSFFVKLEPYIRSTLMALVSADRSTVRGLVSSEQKANVLMLHVKVVMLLASTVDPSYLESILKVFSELKLRSNHDALALWLMCNLLLRNCKGNLDLLPADPQESNYCVDYPGCAPTSATCADNAQLVLRLLDRANAFSAEMRKLVGCSVCKLIQDFNVQSPNIVMTLLSSYGFVPTGLQSLNEFALPAGAGSTFWSFFLRQMKTSAPARTALMAALAKSMSRRFRVAAPADAVVPFGVEPTGHLFTVMMYEAVRRSPVLASAVLFMVSHWVRQADHAPGKFVCLVFMCVQLVTAVVERGEGAEPVEMAAETRQDRDQFDSAARKAAKLLSSQQGRLEKLVPVSQRDNKPEFANLVRRLQRKLRRTIAIANGDVAPGTVDASEYTDLTGAESADDLHATEQSYTHAAQAPYNSTVVALQELHNAADNSVFDDDNEFFGGAADDDDDYGHDDHAGAVTDVPRNAAAPFAGAANRSMRGGDEHNDNGQQSSSLTGAELRGHGAPAPAPTSIHRLPEGAPLSPSALPRGPTKEMGSSRLHDSARVADGEFSGILKKRLTEEPQATASRRPTAAYHEVVSDDDNDNSNDYYRDGARDQRPPARPRSQSRGTQTSAGDERSPAVSRQAQLDSGERAARRQPRSHDKAVTAPFEQSVGTSPISAGAHDERAGPRTSKGVGPAEEGSPRVTSGRHSAWLEPDLTDYVDGDEDPIDETALPHLQATAPGADAEGLVLPSGMVLEYLRTHQAMDSLRHELNQLDQDSVAEQVAQYVRQQLVAQPSASGPSSPVGERGYGAHTVTVEGRVNNYSAPHSTARLAPGRVVTAPVTMTATTPVSRGAPAPRPPADVAVVDGEAPVRAVSETTLAKRRRTEAEAAARGAPLRTPTPNLRGMNFFLYQQQLAGQAGENGTASALQDLQFMQRQRGAMAALAEQQQQQQESSSPATERQDSQHEGELADQQATDENRSPLDRYGNLVSEGLLPTTPYGQVVIPACFVEQKNDTAVRELRQAMGAYDPNDTRLSTAGKQRIRGAGTTAPGSPMTDAQRNGTAGDNSAVWWTAMSTAPMPEYAADAQYSMELF